MGGEGGCADRCSLHGRVELGIEFPKHHVLASDLTCLTSTKYVIIMLLPSDSTSINLEMANLPHLNLRSLGQQQITQPPNMVGKRTREG